MYTSQTATAHLSLFGLKGLQDCTSYIEHNRAAIPVPQKYFYFGPMFRHERPQAASSGNFISLASMSIGMADPRADVEVIALLWRILSDLNLPSLTLEINNLGYTADRDSYRPHLVSYLKQQESGLCANCRHRIDANPLRVLDCKVPECRTITETAPRLGDSLSEAARSYFTQVLTGLDCLLRYRTR